MDHVVAQDLPAALGRFMRTTCGLPAEALHPLKEDKLSETARQLLVHPNDMTSTLATFHESALRVEVLQTTRVDDLYLREVFLRTLASDTIVEYGVIAIALDQFSAPQQAAIIAGTTPLGAVLHQFKIPFVSSPIGYFLAPASALAATPLAPHGPAPFYGRFNRLSRPGGETLAWILEILPQVPA